MPVVSSFYGIVIRMFHQEHGVAHFHAEDQGRRASIGLDGTVLAGDLDSQIALRLIRRWAGLHHGELRRNWSNLRKGEPPERIEPLGRGSSMGFLPTVVRAEYRGAHRIHLTFDDGSSGVVDFSRWLNGRVFAPLRDPDCFARFSVDGGTVTWPNGADIAPETLYEELRSASAAGHAS